MSASNKYDFFNFKREFKLNYVVYYQNRMSICYNLNHFINVDKICMSFAFKRNVVFNVSQQGSIVNISLLIY